MKQFFLIYTLILVLSWPSVATADYITRENFGKKSQFDTSSNDSSTSYQSTWGWEGWNPNSTSSSSSGSSGGGGFWGSSRSTPPPPPDDGGIQAEKDAAKASAKEAHKYYNAGDWRLAMHHATRWMANTGLGNVTAMYIRAAASENLNREEAHREGRGEYSYTKLNDLIKDYETILGWDPNHRQSQQRLDELKSIRAERERIEAATDAYYEGNAFIREKRWEEALAAYRRSAELDPSNPAVYGKIGWLLQHAMDYSEARDAYLEAVAKGSQDPQVFALLAGMHFYFKDYEKAVASARQGIAIDPHKANLHYELGFALEKLYRPKDAVAAYREALRLDPENGDYKLDIAGLLLKLNKLDEAETLIEEVRINDPDNTHLDYLIEDLSWAREREHIETPGALEEDIKNAREAQALNPSEPSGFLAEAKALDDMGRPSEADRVYQQVLELEPENLDALVGLFKNTQRRGDLVKTVQSALRVVAVDPDNFEAAYGYQHIMTWYKEEFDAKLAGYEIRKQELLASISNNFDEEEFEQALIETEEILSFDSKNGSCALFLEGNRIFGRQVRILRTRPWQSTGCLHPYE